MISTIDITRLMRSYPDECPRRLPFIVGQLVDEVHHNAAHDYASKQLSESNAMKHYSRVR
jgi:hypothetical protein